MVGRDYLRNEISHEEYIELRKLRAQDEHLQELRQIVWRDIAEIIRTPDGDLDKSLDQALQLCEQRGGVEEYLSKNGIGVDSKE